MKPERSDPQLLYRVTLMLKKYVSKKHLQFESTLSENALCQNSDLDLSGLTHSDSFFCFPIVLL